jgi:thioredoxin reductase (NADPH)
MPTNEIFDVIIIGGGPTGMFAAVYAGMRELKAKIIETLPVLGGQVEIMYPEKMIFDVGAFPYIKGADFIDQLEKQLAPFDTEVCLEENVLELTKDQDLFEIKTNKTTHYAKTILITTGQGSFEPRKLTFDYPKAYEESNLHYYVSQLETYRDKVIAINGGGDSAVDWALTLEDIAKKVYIVHRRDKFRAVEASVSRLRDSSVEIITPYVPEKLVGDAEKIEEVVFKERRGDETMTIPVDYFIVNFGFISENKYLEDWGLETSRGSIEVAQNMATNVPGIYAAGDVTTFDGKVKLIATGFGEAPTAINSIIQYLNPEKFIQAPATGDYDATDKFKSHLENN